MTRSHPQNCVASFMKLTEGHFNKDPIRSICKRYQFQNATTLWFQKVALIFPAAYV